MQDLSTPLSLKWAMKLRELSCFVAAILTDVKLRSKVEGLKPQINQSINQSINVNLYSASYK